MLASCRRHLPLAARLGGGPPGCHHVPGRGAILGLEIFTLRERSAMDMDFRGSKRQLSEMK